MPWQLWKPAVLLIAMAPSLPAITHPHIIVKESEYAMLQERAQHWPWSAMKSKALTDAKTLTYRPKDSFSAKCSLVHEMAGACALAYLLDPDSRPYYVSKVEAQLVQAMEDLRIGKGTSTDHAYSVIPAHAAFMMYLLLDILYNDLTAVHRQAMEEDCDYIADHHAHSWMESEYSIKAMAELYRNGRSPAFVSLKNQYLNYILNMTTDDGVYSTGPGYANSRLFMDGRMQKKIFMDICEYQGYAEFYRNAKLQHLYEWLFGYSVTPFNRSYTFGDTPPSKDLDHWAVSALRANRFSAPVAQLARWRLGPLTESKLQGRLLHFLLCDTLPQTYARPTSRIFSNGGAWLLQNTDSTTALAGALWNIRTIQSGHTHYDVNAVHLAGYNAHLLRNSGYDGYGEPDAVTWKWINRTAESSNTLMLNGQNHITWQGGGVTESLLGSDWEYARSKTGAALSLAQHYRNLILINPSAGKTHGYFIITDEVRPIFAGSGATRVNIAWHPNSAVDPQLLPAGYRWPVQDCDYGGRAVAVDLLPINRPDSVEIRRGYLGSYEACSRFRGVYLYATYRIHGEQANIGTIFFPSDSRHTAAVLTRLQPRDASGAAVDHGGGLIDYIVVPTMDQSASLGPTTVSGRTAVWRESNRQIESYFLAGGTSFDYRGEQRKGFVAEKKLTIRLRGDNGWILSPGTNVTFYEADIGQILLDGRSVPVLESGESFLRVYLDSGSHTLHLQRKTRAEQQNKSDPASRLLVFPNPFNQSVTLSYELAEPGPATIELYNVRGQRLAAFTKAWQSAGRHQQVWHSNQQSGGMIFCRVRTADKVMVAKMVLEK